MTTQYIVQYPRFRAYAASNNAPLVGGKLYTLMPGTTGLTNLKASYTDANGGTPNTNPVILDANGEADIFGTGFYKLVLSDANDVQLWSKDNIGLPGTSTQAISPWQDSGLTPTYISATSFSFAGNQTAIYQPGMRLKTINGAGTIYSTIVSSAFTTVTTVTVVNDSGVLDASLSSVSYSFNIPQSAVASALQNTTQPTNPVYSFTSNTTQTPQMLNQVVEANSANAITFTLLAANGVPSGSVQYVKNIGAGSLTIAGTIDGAANQLLPNMGSAILFSDGAAWSAFSFSGRLLNIQYFTSPGNGTYTPTVGTNKIIVDVIGGGGAGGGAAVTAANQVSCGAGGMSGAWARKMFTGISGTYSYTVGAGGVGANGANGGNGNQSSFAGPSNVTIVAGAGFGGNYLANSGTPAICSALGTSTSSNGDISSYGAMGGFGAIVSTTLGYAGTGGSSVLSAGGAGYPSVANGQFGAFGSGGGGSINIGASNNTIKAGGNGGNGVIIVWEFS